MIPTETIPAPVRRAAVLALPLTAALVLAGPARAGCDAEVGRRRVETLVRRCIEVSPATRPPCNAANACALIEGEIARGCRILAGDAPAWCRDAAE